MFHPIPKGSVESIYGYNCQLPPVGWGKNCITGELEHIGVHQCSTKRNEQIWFRTGLPKDYEKREKKELQNQKIDEEYVDEYLEKIREEHWKYRLCGYWIMIDGVETYLTGLHWFYLNWIQIDIGFPHYRDNDRKSFYVWRYCEEDPCCGGLLSVDRRRAGKTYKLGTMLLEYISRTKNANAGIQSKTGPDAKAVFQKAVVNPFKKLPSFFRPVFDTASGVTPTTTLRFTKTTKKGKGALDDLDKPELDSFIDWKSSELFAMDGRKEMRHGEDEVGKTQEVDVYERWQVNRFCLDQDGEWVGKGWLSTTVEEMENGGAAFKRLWDASDPNIKDKNGRTQSGLYRLFMPAFETTLFDKFGKPRIEEAKVYYLNQREGLKNDPRALSSIIRKNPFTEHEMFRIDGDKCLYNSELLNDQLDALNWMENTSERGDLIWENGIRDSKVVWKKHSQGRWEICWMPDETNNVAKVGNMLKPLNTAKIVAGGDTFSHNIVKDSRRSDGALVVKLKFDVNTDNPYNDSFVCLYKYRAESTTIQYEDMLKTAVFYGCQILFESNKNSWRDYFVNRGYEGFLMKLKAYPDYGIPANPKTHELLAEVTEEHILQNSKKVFFKPILTDWLHFDINNTTAFDTAMAAGYALIADNKIWQMKQEPQIRKLSDYGFKKTKIA